MNETNRTAITIIAGVWIVLMAVVIFLVWTADDTLIDRLGDFVEYLQANVEGDTAGRLIVTLGALALVALAMLIIVIELAPEDEERELRVEQAGSTTIVPAQALKLRLEEALTALPEVAAARARVFTREKGIASNLDVTITPGANIATVTREASRIVVDTIQTELGLPVAGLPTVRILFGGAKPTAATAASSILQRPQEAPAPLNEREIWGRPIEGLAPLAQPEAAEMMGSADDAAPAEPAVVDPLEGTYSGGDARLEEPAVGSADEAHVGGTKSEDTGPDEQAGADELTEPRSPDTAVEERRPDETPGW